MRTFVGSKIHGITVTAASVEYHGSVGISRDLLDIAGIRPFERVTIVNLNNGERWDTYALPVEQAGVFTLNGGSARLGVVDDPCVVMTWQTGDEMLPAPVVFLDEHNRIDTIAEYAPNGHVQWRAGHPLVGASAEA